MKPYPLKYPTNIPVGLVPSKCTGCQRLWWVEPPPTDVGHCMCCGGKLHFLIAAVSPGPHCICEPGQSLGDCPVCGAKLPETQPGEPT